MALGMRSFQTPAVILDTYTRPEYAKFCQHAEILAVRYYLDEYRTKVHLDIKIGSTLVQVDFRPFTVSISYHPSITVNTSRTFYL